MPEGSLDAALDELYGADPSDFVATRKRLAADLRASSETGAAKALQGARRPSTSAWALNQLARREPDLVEALLDRSSELQAAQTRAVSGKPDALRDAIREHRKALDDATSGALAILGSRANEGFRGEIASTLRAASADDDTAALLRTGRLIHEAEFQGFPGATGLTLVPDLPESKKPAPQKPVPQKPAKKGTARDDRDAAAAAEAATKAEREQEREQQARRRASRAARDAAAKQAAKADTDATRARARIDKLEAELDDARRALDDALERSRNATDEAARHEAEADNAGN